MDNFVPGISVTRKADFVCKDQAVEHFDVITKIMSHLEFHIGKLDHNN